MLNCTDLACVLNHDSFYAHLHHLKHHLQNDNNNLLSDGYDADNNDILGLRRENDSDLSSLHHVDAPNDVIYMACGVVIAMLLVGLIIILVAVTINKLRKRDESIAASSTAVEMQQSSCRRNSSTGGSNNNNINGGNNNNNSSNNNNSGGHHEHLHHYYHQQQQQQQQSHKLSRSQFFITSATLVEGSSAANLVYGNGNNSNNNNSSNNSSMTDQSQINFTRTSSSATVSNGWVFPPKVPTPNIYDCKNDFSTLIHGNDKHGFKQFRKQFSGRFKRLLAKKPPEDAPAIPPELKCQLKSIYVY